MLLELFSAVTVLFFVYTYIINRRPRNYPTGPVSWPIFGNYPQIALSKRGGLLHLVLSEYSKKFGKVFTFDFSRSFRSIVICDAKILREAYNNPAVSGRKKLLMFGERTGGVVRGIIFNDGEEWVEQRRFALRHLRDFGFGKTSMESMIMDEVEALITRLKQDSGRPLSTHNYFNVAVLNALWTISTGERLKYDDSKTTEIMAALSRSLHQGFAAFVASFFPALAKVAPRLIGWEEYKKDLAFTYQYLRTVTERCLQEYDGNSEKSFSDAYIREMKKTKDSKSSFYGERGQLTMTAVLLDLFTGGADTTSATLSWACLYMALHPDKQSKLHEEIDRILGNKTVTSDDRLRLPYTEAAILEVMRIAPVVGTAVHKTTEDISLAGYDIPKGMAITANIWYILHNPETWGDPENFRPERFINDDGSCNSKHEAFIPFSVGKRVCLGEGLARLELFMFFTSIFQNFEVTWDRNGPMPVLDPTDGIITAPKPQQLIFETRKPSF